MFQKKLLNYTGILLPIAILSTFFYVATLFSQSKPDSETDKPENKKTLTASERKPDQKMKAITLVTGYLLANQHYSGKRLEPELSDFIFNEYLKYLDPGKMFFTLEDIETLSKDRAELSTLVKKGDSKFGFDAFERFIKRFTEYEEYARDFLSKDVPLNSKDTFEYDRSKIDWPENDAALKDLWRRKLTNDIILANLSDKAAEEKAAKSEKAEEPGKTENTDKAVPFLSTKTPQERILKRIAQLKSYYEQLDSISVLEFYLTTVAGVFDPHSQYMSPRTGEDFDITMKLSLQGIGATLTSEDGYTKVVSLVPGGPADRQGSLKAEDRIIAVSQAGAESVDVIDMPLSKVVDMIRGKSGTKVTLTVLEASKGGRGVPVQITITRDKVEIKDSEARGEIKIVKDASGAEKKIGVIVLPSFYMDFEAARRGKADFKSSSGDVKKILESFIKDGVDGVVIDLRSNGGGSLYEAVELTALFVDGGPVVQVRTKNEIEVQDADKGKAVYAGPLLVMTNRLSASASEIFAAAIRDYGRGFVLGDAKTHGKGSVQVVSELDRFMPLIGGTKFKAGFLKLTNAKFYRINGDSTQLRGVVPDVIFPAFTDHMEIGEDKLEHALIWDSIEPAVYNNVISAVDAEKLSLNLAESSSARIKTSSEFKKLVSSIGDFKRIKDKKMVVLNLDERWEEYLEDKRLADEQEKIYSEADKSGKNKKEDIYLNETLNVMLDLIPQWTYNGR